MRAWFIGLGALAGAVTGLLVAPQSGREFRSAVRRRVGAGGKAVRGRWGRWSGYWAGVFHRVGNRLERVEHAAAQGTPAEPRVRAVFNRAEELPQR